MIVSTVAPEITFGAQYSWEATTLDYLSPRWYDFEDESFATEAEADAFVAAKRAANSEARGEPCAYRTKKVVAPRPEAGYVDPFLEAEFAANRQYWADRAAVARNAEAAQRDFQRCYGRGATVKVVKGRKVPVGTEGEVFWLGDKGWGYSVGFKTVEGDKHFTAVTNVESTSAAYAAEEA